MRIPVEASENGISGSNINLSIATGRVVVRSGLLDWLERHEAENLNVNKDTIRQDLAVLRRDVIGTLAPSKDAAPTLLSILSTVDGPITVGEMAGFANQAPGAIRPAFQSLVRLGIIESLDPADTSPTALYRLGYPEPVPDMF